MKRILLALLLTVAVSSIGVRLVSAAESAPDVNAIEDLLHQAETAADPTSLLDKAKAEFKKFDPKPKLVGASARSRGGVDRGAEKRKEEATRAIDEAITAAKTFVAAPKADPNALGAATSASPADDLKAKIENAVTKVHMAGELKH